MLDKREIDLEQVAQRILKLAEVAMLEHLEMLMRSQAAAMVMAVREPRMYEHAEG
jgi:hypothetical protein